MLDTPNSAIAADLPHSFMTTPRAFARGREAVVEAMARVIRVHARQGEPTSAYDFAVAGISTGDVHANWAAAKAIADAEVIRQDAIDEPEPQLDPWVADADYRTIRIDKAAAVVVGGIDEQMIFALLRAGGAFSAREIGDLWPQIMAEVGHKLASVKLPPVA